MGRSRKGRRSRRSPARRRQPRGRWSAEIRQAFLAMLRETGNARACYRALGHENMFRKRRRTDPTFAADWQAAVAEADARWRGAENAFPEAAAGGGAAGTPPPCCAWSPSPANAGEELDGTPSDYAGYLKPGRKRKASRAQAVIRRTSNGRCQVTLAREGHWTGEIEADFLARLRATGNFSACARAVGFQPASVFDRVRKWPAFKRACDEALEEASVQLDYRLVEHAHNLLRTGAADDADEETEDETPIDPAMAMRILSFLDARKGGRTRRGPRKGPPERPFEEAVRSVLAKIEAIERHEKWKRDQDGGNA